MSDDTLLKGDLTEHLEPSQLTTIQNALEDAGFAVAVNFADGSFTVQPNDEEPATQSPAVDGRETGDTKVVVEHDATDEDTDGTDSSRDTDEEPDADTADVVREAVQDTAEADREKPDEDTDDKEAADASDDEDDEEPPVMVQRAARLENGMDHGTAYTSRELAAMAFDIDEDEVGASERATLNPLKDRTSFTIKSMPHPDGLNKKLYYRGSKPAMLEDPEDTDEDSDDSQDGESTGKTYTCDACDGEFDAPVTANPKYHDCAGTTDGDGSSDNDVDGDAGKNQPGARHQDTMTA